MPDIERFILDYLQAEYAIPPDVCPQALNFVEAGYVDSIGVIRFIAELEDTFGIEFSDEELTSPAFRTVGTLTGIIEGKIGR
jgi:acyl carrier protein